MVDIKSSSQSLIARALWHLETHMAGALTLEGAARDLGTTPSHLTRAFAMATGLPVMRYVWRRRLTRAAQTLAEGGDTVLNTALDAGYASPEAFTRAFRAQFGLPPSRITGPDVLAALPLQLPINVSTLMTAILSAPRIEIMPERRFAGLSRRYDMETRAAIPGQWAAYNEQGVTLPEAIPEAWYGVCHDFAPDGRFGYLCGMELSRPAALPAGWSEVRVPAGPVARFRHDGPITTMNSCWSEIYSVWLGRPGLVARPGPSIEYYPPEFNGMTGEGGFEIWVPVEG